MQSGTTSLPIPTAVILDLDGTLVDTVGTRIEAWLAVFGEVGIRAGRELLAPLIGMDGRRLASDVAAAAGAPIDEAQAEEIDRRAGERYGALNSDPRPLPGTSTLLAALDRRRIRWAVATSSRQEQVAASIDALSLPRRPLVVDGSHVEHAKPAPDLLLLAADRLQVAPGSCWYVGDSTWDMEAATAAGMVAIGSLAGAAVDEAALGTAGASVVVRRLDELVTLLE